MGDRWSKRKRRARTMEKGPLAMMPGTEGSPDDDAIRVAKIASDRLLSRLAMQGNALLLSQRQKRSQYTQTKKEDGQDGLTASEARERKISGQGRGRVGSFAGW
jgi:hypothetical protein